MPRPGIASAVPVAALWKAPHRPYSPRPRYRPGSARSLYEQGPSPASPTKTRCEGFSAFLPGHGKPLARILPPVVVLDIAQRFHARRIGNPVLLQTGGNAELFDSLLVGRRARTRRELGQHHHGVRLRGSPGDADRRNRDGRGVGGLVPATPRPGTGCGAMACTAATTRLARFTTTTALLGIDGEYSVPSGDCTTGESNANVVDRRRQDRSSPLLGGHGGQD